MGKRGPAPKGPYADKSEVLSTRIRPDTRTALVTAASAKGVPLSQEIEHRLRRTFQEDQRAIDNFGTLRNRALMKMIANVMQTAWHPDRPNVEWLDDPWLFEQTIRTINMVLMAVRPPGRAQPPADRKLRWKLRHIDAMERAADMWHFVQQADASLPLEADAADQIFNRLKADLGETCQRPLISAGTPQQAVRANRAVERAMRQKRVTSATRKSGSQK
jgi:hypothetical protein